MKEINAVHIILAFVVLFLIGVALLVTIECSNKIARMHIEEQHDFDNYAFIMPDNEVLIPAKHICDMVSV